MKILMISEYFPPFGKGGGEISAYLLAKELVRTKIKVHVLTSHFPGLKKKETKDGIIIHRLLKTGKNPSSILGNLKRSLFFNRSLLKELNKLDKKENFDVVHCMNTTSIRAVDLKNKFKKPFVVHVNSPVPFCPKGTLMYKDKEICNLDCNRKTFLDCYLNSKTIGKHELNFFTKYNPLLALLIRKRFEEYQKKLQNFDFYLPISTYMEKRLIKEGIPKNKVKVIYNLTDFKRFLKLKSSKKKIPKILYLGPYTKPKGPQIIIEALKKIKLPYEANFYGYGSLKQYLLREVTKNELNVKIHDKISYKDIPKIIGNHDIVIFPSLVGEAFGRVALEACAAGKIVIASKIGGVVDIIEHNKTGYLFTPGSVNKLKKIIERVLKNKSSIKKKLMRTSIKNKFSNEKTVKLVINIYKSLVTK